MRRGKGCPNRSVAWGGLPKRDAAQRALAGPGLAESIQQALTRRMERCRQLIPFEARLSAVLAGKEPPGDFATQLALAEWLLQDQHRPYAAVQLYQAVFSKQPSLADDLDSQNRFLAACAAGQAGCGLGADTADLDEAVKAGLRKQALAWLAAERDACEKLFLSGADAVRLRAVKAMAACQGSRNLDCVRDQAALAKLPAAESSAGKSCGMESPRSPSATRWSRLIKLTPA